MTESMILYAAAKIDDKPSLESLLEPLPNADQLRHLLVSGQTGRSQLYDKETQVARYVVSDGELVHCYSVTAITLQQAAEIAAECDSIKVWNIRAFQDAVQRVLGELTLVQ